MKELIAFPDEARIWIYQSDREFSASESEEIQDHINRFCAVWTSHNRLLRATGGLLHHRFVILVVDETRAGASGCSIDKSIAFIKWLEQEYSVDLLNRLNFAYLAQENVRIVHRNQLSAKFASGEIEAQTPVFNNLVKTKKEFVESWVIPLEQSWMMRFTKKPSAI